MLTRRDLAWIGLCALATVAITLVATDPGAATAVDVAGPRADIPAPVLSTEGYQLSVRPSGDAAASSPAGGMVPISPGEMPPLELVATNTGSSESTIHWNATLRVQTMRDMLSRVARPSPATWQEQGDLTLEPGQTSVIKLPAGVKLDAGSRATLNLQVGKQQISALTVITKPAVTATR